MKASRMSPLKMKDIITIEASKASGEIYQKLRHEPLIIRNEMKPNIRASLSWRNVAKSLPDMTIQVTESLATTREEKGANNRKKYYCKLHDYISYCKGGNASFTVQTGLFDIKSVKLNKLQKRLYLLSLNCNKNPKLIPWVTLHSRFGDWFKEYFPEYMKEVVYDKGHTWFFIGPEDTESELHSDHNFVHTTLQQCDGSKEVFLLDPSTTMNLTESYGMAIKFIVKDGGCIMSPKKDDVLERNIDEKVIYGVLEPGDTLYIPSRWGHMVRAKSKSITISRDFIDERNADAYFTSMCRRSLQ